jgi:hypothetical protein
MASADPVLTANIYSNRGLDELIHGAIVPFRQELRDRDPDGGWALWLVRYSRCGEHLKVRLHGPAGGRDAARELLERSVEAHFASLPPAPDEAPRVSRPDAPPIDVEDEAASDFPDRTLLWTRYRRSHVNLGPPPFLEDDRYAELFTACLGAGAELVLDALRPDSVGAFSGAARQRGLLAGLLGGLEALDLTAAERAAYLAYHRDWLVRFSVKHPAQQAEVGAHFDRRLDGMRPVVDKLRRSAAAQREARTRPGDAVQETWRGALADLRAYLVRFRGDPRFHVDPFTDDVVFPPVFKVFHSLANHLGVSMLDEAFVHHLLLHASADEPAARAAEAVEA